MELLFWSGICAISSYMVVKYFQKEYPHLDVEPMNYAVGSLLIGGLWVMLYFAYKVHEHKKYGKYHR